MKKRSDGLYSKYITVTENGKKTRKVFYGKTQSELTRKLLAYHEKSEAGETFETVADLWWEEAERALQTTTAKSYRPAMERAITHFGRTPIREIKPSDINRFLRDFIRRTNAADKTARTQLLVINLICKYSVANGYTDLNPARDVSVPSGLRKNKRSMPPQNEIDMIRQCKDCTFGMFPVWLIYTGIRKGELLALRWEDIDFDKKTISITKAVYHEYNKPKLKSPKTAAGYRTVPLMKSLEEMITPGKGYIFPGENGDPLCESTFKHLWYKYQKESGTSFTAHQLRHAYTTLLIENNIPPTDAQYFLGHAQLSTTMDIYREYRDTQKDKAMQAVRELNF